MSKLREPVWCRYFLVFVPFLLMLFLNGCTDVTEVNKRVLVSTIGFDAAKKAGELKVYIQYSSLASNPGGGGLLGAGGTSTPNSPKVAIRTASGKSVAGAMRKLRSRVPGQLFLGTVRLVVFSADFARSGVSEPLDFLMANPFLSIHAPVVIVQGNVGEFLRGPTQGEDSAADHIAKIFQGGRSPAASLTPLPLYQLYDRTVSPIGAVWTLLAQILPDGPGVTGAALLQAGRLVHTVSLQDASLLNIIQTAHPIFLELPSAQKDGLPLGLQFRTAEITSRLEPTAGKTLVEMKGSAYVVENPSANGAIKDQDALRKYVNQAVTKRLAQFLEMMYATGIDVLKLGDQLRQVEPDGTLDNVPSTWFREITFDVQSKISVLHGLRGR